MTTVQTQVKEEGRQASDPLTLLKQVIHTNRSASDIKVKAIFRGKVLEDDDINEAVVDGYVDYYLSYARREPAAPPRTVQERRAEQQQIDGATEAARVATRVAIAKVVTLTYLMPNGKRLGDCTFGEIAIIGGFFFRLSQKGAPDQLVRDVLSTAQVKELVAS